MEFRLLGPVTIVEGPFDVIKAAENVIALQGSILRTGSRLFRKLVEKSPAVYLALDSDATEKQFSIAERLAGFDVDVRIVPLGERKDVGEMTKNEFIEMKKLAEPVSGLGTLKMRVRNL